MSKKKSGKRYRKVARHAEEQGYIVDTQGKLVHRVVYRRAYGKIPKGWVVHHIDFNRRNNRPENLYAMPDKLHRKIHAEMAAGNFVYTREQLDKIVKPYRDNHNRFVAEWNKIEDAIAVLKQKQETLENQIAGGVWLKPDVGPEKSRYMQVAELLEEMGIAV